MTLRVLVAEDEPINRHIALALLQELGHQADAALTGQQVLLALERQRYDVILMDVHMPEMDGFEATRHIIARYAQHRPAIIAFTSVQQCHCQAAGMDAYLSKPLSLDSLKHILKKYDLPCFSKKEHANNDTPTSFNFSNDCLLGAV
jgi:CheY-like chemotaxis protein